MPCSAFFLRFPFQTPKWLRYFLMAQNMLAIGVTGSMGVATIENIASMSQSDYAISSMALRSSCFILSMGMAEARKFRSLRCD